MKTWLARQNRRLLFRLFLLLAVGLVTVAALLDYGFRELQARLNPLPDPWRDAGVELMATRLAQTAPADRDALAAELSATLGMPVQFLGASDVVGEAGTTQALSDADGRITWLAAVPDADVVIRIGPLEAAETGAWLDLVPPLFYLAIFGLLALWLRPLLKDLDTITASTRAFATDYRAPRRTAPAVSSLKELAENFDAMAARLSALIQGQKELTSALSHEMRTPLARIHFALAVIGDDANDRQREELAAIGEDVQEIDRLITTMLNYARLDHPDTRMDWQSVEAWSWLEETVDRSRLPDIDVRFEVDHAARELRIDRRLMTLALSNLLVNACRHASKRVIVQLGNGDGRWRLAVHDDGEGIPEADYERVFKAFTRLDGSRSRDTGGSGLGLAIVARIANLHGGDARAGRSPTLGGACMTIAWPKQDS